MFWLSGLCTSKQYPLSGNLAIANSGTPLAPYNANNDFMDNALNVTIDRDIFFDFTSGRLVNSPAGIPGIKSYNQPEGRGNELAYRYRDSKSYTPSDPTVALAYHVEEADGTIVFFNPATFQIICPGIDGQITRQTGPAAVVVTDVVVLAMPSANADPEQDDNITNFASGRLDTVFE